MLHYHRAHLGILMLPSTFDGQSTVFNNKQKSIVHTNLGGEAMQ